MFITLANSIVSRSALGQKFQREDGKENFGTVSKKAMELLGSFCFEDFFPYLGFMDVLTGFSARLRKTFKELHTLLSQVIEEHQKSVDDDHSDKKDLVDILPSLQKEGMSDINFTQENLIAILMDMFVGGTDTTAVTMEWAMAELIKNPNLMKKAQEEVRRVVGGKSRIDESDINKMSYLKCIIKETLRLHAPSVITRASSSERTKVEGYEIPPRTKVLINVWVIQRDPNLWERPEEFIPERFMDNPVDFKGLYSQLTPFGMGRRNCPGILFAVTEVEYVVDQSFALV